MGDSAGGMFGGMSSFAFPLLNTENHLDMAAGSRRKANRRIPNALVWGVRDSKTRPKIVSHKYLEI